MANGHALHTVAIVLPRIQGMSHEALRDLFRCIGEVDQVKLCKNKETKLSLGYGFVKYKREEDAMKAVQQLNGRTIQNKRIKVSFARPSSDIIKVNEKSRVESLKSLLEYESLCEWPSQILRK